LMIDDDRAGPPAEGWMHWETCYEAREDQDPESGVVRRHRRGHGDVLGRARTALGAGDPACQPPALAARIRSGAPRQGPGDPPPRPVRRHALQGDEPPLHRIRPARPGPLRPGGLRRGPQTVATRGRGLLGHPRDLARSGGAGDRDLLLCRRAALHNEVPLRAPPGTGAVRRPLSADRDVRPFGRRGAPGGRLGTVFSGWKCPRAGGLHAGAAGGDRGSRRRLALGGAERVPELGRLARRQGLRGL
jgi:hypothetical protein